MSALALALALVVGLLISRQRALTRRVGSFVCAVRAAGAGDEAWVDGVARYGASDLRWWRALSLAPRPARTWKRDSLEIIERTVLDEVDELGRPLVRAHLSAAGTSVEIKLSSAPYAGLVSWLEAGPRTVGSSS